MPPPRRGLAIGRRPDIVYASDPLGAAPGLLAARLSGARLVYHEHDTPNPGTLHPWLARQRRAAARRAAAVILPNEARSRIARDELGFSDDRLHIVWNMPRRCELPVRKQVPGRAAAPLLSRQRLACSIASYRRRSGSAIRWPSASSDRRIRGARRRRLH